MSAYTMITCSNLVSIAYFMYVALMVVCWYFRLSKVYCAIVPSSEFGMFFIKFMFIVTSVTNFLQLMDSFFPDTGEPVAFAFYMNVAIAGALLGWFLLCKVVNYLLYIRAEHIPRR